MKKIALLMVCVTLLSTITACNNNTELKQLRQENEKLKEQLEELTKGDEGSRDPSSESENSLRPKSTMTASPAPTLTSTKEPTPEPTKKEQEKEQEMLKKIEVKVYDKKVLPIDYESGRYSEFIELDFKVKNGTTKTIKGIQGTMEICDQFDETIMNMNWDISEGKIKPGATKKITGWGIDYNQFMNSHQKVYRTAYEDLIFKYHIKQVIYSDGTKVKLNQE